MSFNYVSNTSVHSVPGDLYKLDKTTFANATDYPPNACFHNNLPSGLQNSTKCKAESAAFLSFPHFHLADPSFADKLAPGSVNPNAERHESRIVLEPVRLMMMMKMIDSQAYFVPY